MKMLAAFGSMLGGWLGWWLGMHIGIMTAVIVSSFGAGGGFYLARRWMQGLQ